MNGKKIIRNVCLGLFFFLSGVEYAVILPTLNGYLISLDAQQAFLGIILSAFSFSGLVAAPIYGKITDKTRSTKLCVIIGNVFEIVGNCIYVISWNKYIVLGARLIAGIGSGVASSIFGMISRTTSQEERTAVFSLFMSLRQVGLIVGPAFNLFLHSLDFKIGKVTVNEYTSPGLLMAVIWLIHTILLITMYTEAERKPESLDETYAEISSEGKKKRTRTLSIREARSFIGEFIREEVIVCLTATFLVMFSQTGIEAAVTPMTLLYFDWKSLQNSYLFCGASGIVVITFVAISRLSKRFSDRSLMLCGCIGMVITYGVLLAYTLTFYLEDYTETPLWVLPTFLAVTAILTVAVPFIWVPQASLFSKVTSAETQAFNQGIRIVAMGLGQILGPIWASSLASAKGLPIMSGVDLFLMLMITVMTVLSYKKLRPRVSDSRQYHDSEYHASTSHENVMDAADEKTPLFGNKNIPSSIN